MILFPSLVMVKRDGTALGLAALMLLLASCGRQMPVEKRTTTCEVGKGVPGAAGQVIDGDTFRFEKPGAPVVVVRLDQIDAPEKTQPWANRSRQLLGKLLGNQPICVVGKRHDRYGRLIGTVYANGTDVNHEMVRQGAAWAYRQYLRDQTLLRAEQSARSNKAGLWSMPAKQTIPPWEFRHPGLAGRASRPPAFGVQEIPGVAHLPPECSPRRSCRELNSCEQAKAWAAKCGSEGIDGDGDGLPCEGMCSKNQG